MHWVHVSSILGAHVSKTLRSWDLSHYGQWRGNCLWEPVQRNENRGSLGRIGSGWNNTWQPLVLAAREHMLHHRAYFRKEAKCITPAACQQAAVRTSCLCKHETLRQSHPTSMSLYWTNKLQTPHQHAPNRESIKRHHASPHCFIMWLVKHGQRLKWCQPWCDAHRLTARRNTNWMHKCIHLWTGPLWISWPGSMLIGRTVTWHKGLCICCLFCCVEMGLCVCTHGAVMRSTPVQLT